MHLRTRLRNHYPRFYDAYVHAARSREIARKLAKIGRIISEAGEPKRLDDEVQFAALQARDFPQAQPYNFDFAALWRRAAERVMSLMDKNVVGNEILTILDVGCGDGMTGYCLYELGHEVTLTDLRDWREQKARNLRFVSQDACDPLAFPDNYFDLVMSFNAFEHFRDPRKVLREVVRVCKAGGLIFLDFGPLFCSPWGLHAWSIRFPYPQFLFSREFIANKTALLSVTDLGRTIRELQPTNGWRIEEYRDLWRTSGCDVLLLQEDRDTRYLDLIEEFPHAFLGQRLTVQDLTINSILLVLKKPPRFQETQD